MKRARTILGMATFGLTVLSGCRHFASLDRGVASLPTMAFDSVTTPPRPSFLAPSLDSAAASSVGCSACAH